MDPISQAAVGAAIPQSMDRSGHVARVALIGGLAGMAPDLDVLIRSSSDPLLFLVYHRQFTHSLIFIPLGALLCSLALWPLARGRLSFASCYWVAFLGYGSHGLLDACTTYGTLLLWPFSDVRVAWNNVSVVDPLFTLPLLLTVLLAARTGRRWIVRAGMLWALTYLLLGVIQGQRAEAVGHELALSRGHTPIALSAKPGFANLLLWKVIYEHDGRYYVDAVRAGLTPTVYVGDSVEKLQLDKHLPWLDKSSQQARDIERFRWFSAGYLAIDAGNPLLVTDMRYSMLPNEIDALWGIELDPSASKDAHVGYHAQRSAGRERIAALLDMLRGSP